MRNQAWVVFRKELLETLRDRRTLAVMIVVPVLLYPALLVLTEQLALLGVRRLEAEALPAALSGPPWPEFHRHLVAHPGLELRTPVPDPDPGAAIRAQQVRVVLLVEGEGAGRRITVLYNPADERSQRARVLALEAVQAWRDTLVVRSLRDHGLSPAILRPISLADSSVALPGAVGGYALGRFLPMLLVFMTLLGAFYPAIDLAAGEKERGTLEALLTVPVPAGNLVAGKFMAVATVGTVAAALNLSSMLLTFRTGLFRFGNIGPEEVGLSLSTVLVIFGAIVPLAVLFGALFLGIAVRSRSFKEAQNALTPVYLAVLIPALLPLLPGIELTQSLAVIPVAGATLLIRDALSGGVAPAEGMIALASTVAWAALALWLAARSFGSEGVLFGVEEERPGRSVAAPVPPSVDGGLHAWGSLPRPRQAAYFIAGVALLFFYGGRIFPALLGEVGLMAAQIVLLLVPALLFVALGGFRMTATLALRPPSPPQLAGGLLVMAGGIPLAWLIAWLQSLILPLPEGFLEAMTELLDAESLGRLVWLLLLLAVTPAICEEVVFRGVLLSGTRSLGAPRAIALNAAVFGAFHLSFESAFRLLPTLWLGLLLALAVWYTRSLWVGMAMHFMNNGAVVTLASIPGLRERFADPGAPPPWFLIPVGALLLAAGLRLMIRPGEGRSASTAGAPVAGSPS